MWATAGGGIGGGELGGGDAGSGAGSGGAVGIGVVGDERQRVVLILEVEVLVVEAAVAHF